jgi:hypothetical protein
MTYTLFYSRYSVLRVRLLYRTIRRGTARIFDKITIKIRDAAAGSDAKVLTALKELLGVATGDEQHAGQANSVLSKYETAYTYFFEGT